MTANNIKKQYEYLIARAINSNEGRAALATALVQPIRKALDYMGIARKVLAPDYIPDGVFAVYEKDVDVVALKVPKMGEVPTPQILGDQVAVDTFLIGVNPEITRTKLRQRRFNVINRIQDRARATIQELEDATMFTLLTAAVAATDSYTGVTHTGSLGRDTIATAYSDMRDRDVIPTKFIAKPSYAKYFLTWSNADFDPITQHQVLKTGLFGKLWGMDVYLTKKGTAKKAFLTSEPEFLGVMPIRTDIEVLDSPNNREVKLGWTIYEEIGMAILNNQGVHSITKTD